MMSRGESFSQMEERQESILEKLATTFEEAFKDIDTLEESLFRLIGLVGIASHGARRPKTMSDQARNKFFDYCRAILRILYELREGRTTEEVLSLGGAELLKAMGRDIGDGSKLTGEDKKQAKERVAKFIESIDKLSAEKKKLQTEQEKQEAQETFNAVKHFYLNDLQILASMLFWGRINVEAEMIGEIEKAKAHGLMQGLAELMMMQQGGGGGFRRGAPMYRERQ